MAGVGAWVGVGMKVRGGMVSSPTGPDVERLVLFLFSVSVARQMASWEGVGVLKQWRERRRAKSLKSARMQNSLHTHAGGTVLLKATVKQLARCLASVVRLFLSMMPVPTHAMIFASVIIL